MFQKLKKLDHKFEKPNVLDEVKLKTMHQIDEKWFNIYESGNSLFEYMGSWLSKIEKDLPYIIDRLKNGSTTQALSHIHHTMNGWSYERVMSIIEYIRFELPLLLDIYKVKLYPKSIINDKRIIRYDLMYKYKDIYLRTNKELKHVLNLKHKINLSEEILNILPKKKKMKTKKTFESFKDTTDIIEMEMYRFLNGSTKQKRREGFRNIITIQRLAK